MKNTRHIRPEEAELMRAIVRKSAAAKGVVIRAQRQCPATSPGAAVPQLLAPASQAVGLAGGDEVAALREIEGRVFYGGRGSNKMSQEAADFFSAEIASQKVRLARIEAEAHTSGLFARRRWLEAAGEAIREGRAICQRSTRQIYKPWSGRMGVLSWSIKSVEVQNEGC